MDMCIQKCIRSKREGVGKGHNGRSRRNAYYQEDNGMRMVKFFCIVDDY